MKNQQICPYCGKELDVIDNYNYYKKNHNFKEISIKHDKYYFYSNFCLQNVCPNCKTYVDNVNRKYLDIINIITIISTIIIMLRFLKFNEHLNFISFWILVCIPIIICHIIVWVKLFYTNNGHQHFVMKESLKPCFKATLNSPLDKKSIKKDFLLNNILEVKANNQSCKVLISKIQNDEYTFICIPVEKDTAKSMLENCICFQVTNGVDILGTLNINKIYDF